MKAENTKAKRGRPAGSQADTLILMGAIRAFTKHGFSNCTVAHILEESGCSRTNFYRFFKNKEEIFTRLISVSFERLEENLSESFLDGKKFKTLDSQLEQFFTLHYEGCFSLGELVPIMFEAHNSHPEHHHLCDGVRSSQINIILKLLQNNGKPAPDLLLLDALVAGMERILKVISTENIEVEEKTGKAVVLTMTLFAPVLTSSS